MFEEPSEKALDEAFAKAREVTEPWIKAIFVATSAAAAVTVAWQTAKKLVGEPGRRR